MRGPPSTPKKWSLQTNISGKLRLCLGWFLGSTIWKLHARGVGEAVVGWVRSTQGEDKEMDRAEQSLNGGPLWRSFNVGTVSSITSANAIHLILRRWGLWMANHPLTLRIYSIQKTLYKDPATVPMYLTLAISQSCVFGRRNATVLEPRN